MQNNQFVDLKTPDSYPSDRGRAPSQLRSASAGGPPRPRAGVDGRLPNARPCPTGLCGWGHSPRYWLHGPSLVLCRTGAAHPIKLDSVDDTGPSPVVQSDATILISFSPAQSEASLCVKSKSARAEPSYTRVHPY